MDLKDWRKIEVRGPKVWCEWCEVGRWSDPNYSICRVPAGWFRPYGQIHYLCEKHYHVETNPFRVALERLRAL